MLRVLNCVLLTGKVKLFLEVKIKRERERELSLEIKMCVRERESVCVCAVSVSQNEESEFLEDGSIYRKFLSCGRLQMHGIKSKVRT